MNTRPENLHATDRLSVSRRNFLKGSAGLVVAFSIVDPSTLLAAAGEAEGSSVASPSSAKLYAWLAIDPDNTATLFTGKVETGTGVETALAQIAAEELEFPVDRLDVVMGTTSRTVDQGPTYGSMTVRYAGPQIRHAAAATRKALLDMAAEHFKLPAQQLIAKDGKVAVIGAPDQSVTFGELVDGKRLDIDIEATGNDPSGCARRCTGRTGKDRAAGKGLAPGRDRRAADPVRQAAAARRSRPDQLHPASDAARKHIRAAGAGRGDRGRHRAAGGDAAAAE